MLNKVTLIGNLGADPEVRTLNDGFQITNLRVATSEKYRDRQSGERKEKTEWHRVTLKGEGLAKYMGYAEKGTMVYIEGKLVTRKWQDQSGADRYSTEIEVHPASGEIRILKDGVERPQEEAPAPAKAKGGRGRQAAPAQQEEGMDDIPF